MAKQTRKTANAKASATLIHEEQETDLHVEEIPASALPAVISADQKAQQEIARFDLARNWIATKKEQYEGLKIASLDDKVGQSAVHKAWQEIRNKRLQVEKKHKEIKGDYLVITRAIDGEKNDLVKLLEEVEDPLKAELDRIENEKEVIKQEAERKAQEKLQGRVAELLEAGMAFNGSYYAIGDTISMDVVTLKAMNDDDYTRLLDRVKVENQKALDAKAEEERRKQEERDRLEQQRKDQQQKEIQQAEKEKELQAERDKLEEQRKNLLASRTKSRAKLLEAIGMTYNFSGFVWQFGTFDMGRITLPVGSVEGLEDELWDHEYHIISAKIMAMKDGQAVKDKERADQELEKRKQAEDERVKAEARLNLINRRIIEIQAKFNMFFEHPLYIRPFKFPEIPNLLLSADQLHNANEEEWTTLVKGLESSWENGLLSEQRIKERKNQEAEQNRQAALSDVERVNEFLRTLAASCGLRPQITDAKIVAAFEVFDNKIAEAINELAQVLDSVK